MRNMKKVGHQLNVITCMKMEHTQMTVRDLSSPPVVSKGESKKLEQTGKHQLNVITCLKMEHTQMTVRV